MSREKVKKFDLLFFQEMIKVETDSGTCYVSFVLVSSFETIPYHARSSNI